LFIDGGPSCGRLPTKGPRQTLAGAGNGSYVEADLGLNGSRTNMIGGPGNPALRLFNQLWGPGAKVSGRTCVCGPAAANSHGARRTAMLTHEAPLPNRSGQYDLLSGYRLFLRGSNTGDSDRYAGQPLNRSHTSFATERPFEAIHGCLESSFRRREPVRFLSQGCNIFRPGLGRYLRRGRNLGEDSVVSAPAKFQGAINVPTDST